MIVGPLKNNIQLSVILLSVICLALWINTVAFSPAVTSNYLLTGDVLFDFIFAKRFPVLMLHIFSGLVVFLSAVLLNFITIHQEITSKNNFLPAFFYILISFTSASTAPMKPILTANMFLLASVYFTLNTYRQEHALPQFFNAGFCLGIATFFYIHYIILFPLLFISLGILRAFNWREWVITMLGIVTPLYAFICLCYLSSKPVFFFYDKMIYLTNFQMPIISEFYIPILVISIVLFAFALFNYITKGFGGKVKTQKARYMLLWLLALCISIIFFEPQSDVILLVGIIPLSIILGDYLAEIKQLKIANTLLVLFIGAFIIQYFHLLRLI